MFYLYLAMALSLLGLLAILFWPGRTRPPHHRHTTTNRNGTGWRDLD